jgi:endo-1,4-beta-xylanase
MHFTHAFAAGLALAGSAIASPTEKRQGGSGLARAMRQRGRSFIGTAVTFRDDPKEAAIYGNKADFNSITPENAMKWESTEPTRGNFTFDDADQYIAYSQEHNVQIHCHNLVWHSQIPDYVLNFDGTPKQLKKIMQEHINALAGRYKGKCTRWDVVNEGLSIH